MKSNQFNALVFSSFTILVLGLFLPDKSYAQYLVGIPGISGPGMNFNDYINALYALSISIAALLAVIKIIIAGMKYMLSGVVSSKQEAIGDIQGAVFGLLIVLLAFTVLNFINPALVNISATISPAIPNPAVETVVNTTTMVANGYSYRSRGTDELWKNTCLADLGTRYILADGFEVCYNAISDADRAIINALYNNYPSTPYPNIDVVNIRFQSYHLPRLIKDTGKLNEIKATKNTDDVLLAVNLDSSRNDWIDRENRGSGGIDATCFELKQVTGKNTRVVYGPNMSYAACIVPN